MKRHVIKLLKRLFDSRRGQNFLRKVHLLVLYLQNYGLSGECDMSGEMNIIRRMSKELSKKNNAVIFDVGANVGKYTLAINEEMTNSYKAYCFEPSPSTFKALQKNTEGIKNINCVNLGLGETTESTVLYFNSESNTQSSVIKRDMSHWGESYNLVNEERINITTLELFCKQENIDFIDFMKVDVEGYEMSMFRGAQEMIKNKKIGTIQFELGVASVDGKYFFKDVFYLLNENYRIYRITMKNLFEIKSYSELYEVFLTTNYLAILR